MVQFTNATGLGRKATELGEIVTAPLKPSIPAIEKTYWIVAPEPAGWAVNDGVTAKSCTIRLAPMLRESAPLALVPRIVTANVPAAGAAIVATDTPRSA